MRNCGGHEGAGLMGWFIYMVRCADGTFYTGVAKDLRRRLAEHNESNRLGSRYTRGRRPVVLVYAEEAPSRAAAVKREMGIKKLKREAKERLAAHGGAGLCASPR